MKRLLLVFAAVAVASGCARNIGNVRRTYANDMHCPAEKIVVLQMPKGDPQRGEAWQVYGCDNRRICFDDNKRGVWACRWPDELQGAAARVKLETNCPTEKMVATAYTEMGKLPTSDDEGGEWAWQGGAYRIEACGTAYVCNTLTTGGASCAAAPDLSKAP